MKCTALIKELLIGRRFPCLRYPDTGGRWWAGPLNDLMEVTLWLKGLLLAWCWRWWQITGESRPGGCPYFFFSPTKEGHFDWSRNLEGSCTSCKAEGQAKKAFLLFAILIFQKWKAVLLSPINSVLHFWQDFDFFFFFFHISDRLWLVWSDATRSSLADHGVVINSIQLEVKTFDGLL